MIEDLSLPEDVVTSMNECCSVPHPDVVAFVRAFAFAGPGSLAASDVACEIENVPIDVVRRSLMSLASSGDVVAFVEVPSRVTGRPLFAAAMGTEMPRTYTDIDGTTFDATTDKMTIRFALHTSLNPKDPNVT